MLRPRTSVDTGPRPVLESAPNGQAVTSPAKCDKGTECGDRLAIDATRTLSACAYKLNGATYSDHEELPK